MFISIPMNGIKDLGCPFCFSNYMIHYWGIMQTISSDLFKLRGSYREFKQQPDLKVRWGYRFPN